MKLKFNLIIIAVASLTSTTVFAQLNVNERTNNTLRGKILYLNSDHKPAIGVKISGKVNGREDANVQYTSSDGSYELVFPFERDGHQVTLEIGEKDQAGQAIEVVNDKEVDICRIPAIATDEFEIIVCAKGARDLAAQNYYNIIKTSSDIALEEKKKELDNLLAAQQKDYKEISTLTKKIDQLENQTDSLVIYRTAWRIASVNKDNANERVLKYIDALDKGKTIQQALNMLNIELASKQVDKGIKITDEGIEELELCAEGSMAVFDFNSAIACYDTIIVKMEQMDKNPLIIADYYNLAWNAAFDGGKLKKALKAGNSALSIRREILAPKHPNLATSYNNIAGTYMSLGHYENALELQQKVIEIWEEILAPKHPDLATSYNNIGVTFKKIGYYKKALEFLEKAITIQEKILNPNLPELASSYNNIGNIYRVLGKYEKALEFHRKSIALQEEILNSKHPNLAISYNNIGNTHDAFGFNKKALEFRQKAIIIQEEVLDSMHPSLAISYDNIGNTYKFLGQYEKALEFHQKAVLIFEEIFGSLHPDLATSYNNIAGSYLSLNKYEKALEFLEKSIEIGEEILDPNHPDLATAYNNIAEIYRSSGAFEKSLRFQQKSIAIQEEILDPKHLDLAISYYFIGNTYKALNLYKKALEFQKKSIRIFEDYLRKGSSNQQIVFNGLIEIYTAKGSILFKQKDYINSLEDFKASNKLQENSSNWNYIGLCYYHLKNYSKAIEAYQQASNLNPELKSQHFYNNIGTAYAKNKQFKKAKSVFQAYEKLFPQEGRPQRNWAMYYALQNEKEKALTHLQKALNLGFDDLEWLKTDDSMDSLRKEPIFIDILKKLEN